MMLKPKEIYFSPHKDGFHCQCIWQVCFGKSFETIKDSFIDHLLAEIYNYLHEKKGYSSSLSILQAQIKKYPGLQLNAWGGFLRTEDSGVRQATQLIDFLINYPEKKTGKDLAHALSSLYVSEREFPFGLGNTKDLRKYIANSFYCYFILINEPINEVDDTTEYQVLDQRINGMGRSALSYLNNYYNKELVILIALKSRLSRDLLPMVMQISQELHFPSKNGCNQRDTYHCLSIFNAPAKIKHKLLNDEKDPAHDFILMS